MRVFKRAVSGIDDQMAVFDYGITVCLFSKFLNINVWVNQYIRNYVAVDDVY
jgi:hypothetical protein